ADRRRRRHGDRGRQGVAARLGEATGWEAEHDRVGLMQLTQKKEARYELVEIPERFGPVEVVVDEAKVRAYAFSQGDYGSWYFGESPFGGPVGHPLVLANDLLFLFYEEYDGNTAQGLHTHEDLTFVNPVHVGERVTVSGGYVEKYERRGQGYVT